MIRHIVAMDQQRGIGKHGFQPWNIPDDEQYFSEMTKTHSAIVLMGRKTYEAIGRPLLSRRNVVATHDESYRPEGVEIVRDISAFLRDNPDTWVIGGGQIFDATMPLTGELYITEIEADFACDVFYPEVPADFVRAEAGELKHQNGFAYRYVRYIRSA